MLDRLRRLLPSRDAVVGNRWLAWLGPTLLHPRLWHMSRRGMALGVAIGVFFGFLIPIAQIPASAAVAVALRANLPSAMASTLVTNPVTFGPVYYAAWQVGSVILGEPNGQPPSPPRAREAAPVADDGAGWIERTWHAITGVGKPLLVGLALFASLFGLSAYLAVQAIWRWRVMRKKRQRRRRPALA